VETLRTPPERFEDLPDFAFAPRYHEWDGMRLAHVDEGDGPPILMIHGQPTWSYLFRKSIPPLVAAGYRCIAIDLPGFGRSDKPADVGWYSYARHVEATASLVEHLDLRDVTLLLHDWGGPIGLRLATGPLGDRVSAFVAMDTVVLTGEGTLGPEWELFRDLVASREDFPAGRMIRMACRTRPPRALAAAYESPYPDASYKAGVRAFPRLIPVTPEDPGAAEGRAIMAALRAHERPALLLWGEHDLMFPFDDFGPRLHAAFPSADPPRVVDGAGHFVFEDRGEQVAALVAEWLAGVRA
jgi:haloalkane dehalogenase